MVDRACPVIRKRETRRGIPDDEIWMMTSMAASSAPAKSTGAWAIADTAADYSFT